MKQFFDPSFGRRSRNPLLRALFLTVLFAQVFWVCGHMYLNSQGLIDPWKLGGYGMYTKPGVKPLALVFRYKPGQKGERIDVDQARFMKSSYFFRFLCRPVSISAIKKLIEDNESLSGYNIRIGISIREFQKNPIAYRRKLHHKIVFKREWNGSYTLQQSVCGKEYLERVDEI